MATYKREDRGRTQAVVIPESESERPEVAHSRVTASYWGFGAAAIMLAFFYQPAIQLADPFEVGRVGSILALAVAAGYVALTDDTLSKLIRSGLAVLTLVGLITGVTGIVGVAEATRRQASVNMARCALLQKRMIGTTAFRADNAALFQALACKPRGNQPIVFDSPRTAQQPSRVGR